MPVALSGGGEGATGEEMKCAYVVMIMAVYWVTEALPLEGTSLIPTVGFPLLGIMSTVSDRPHSKENGRLVGLPYHRAA